MIGYAKLAIAGAVAVGLLFSHGMAWRYGAKLERSEINAERAQEAIEAGIAIEAAYSRKAKVEAQWQAKVSEIDKNHAKKVADNETQRLADMAALDARTLILRDPNRNAEASGNCAAPTASGSSGGDGRSGAELPAKTSQFLLSLAAEADSVTMQLSACQAILRSERE